MTMAIDRTDAAALLAWWVSVGVDEAIGDQPANWFAVSNDAPFGQRTRVQSPATTAPQSPYSAATPAAQPRARPIDAPLGTSEAAETARALAASANTLDELRDAIARFEGLTIKASATNLVFADGNAGSRVMLIGEAPGAEEDRRGLPFVGPAGQLLDRMLAAIGRDRSNCYITNIVNWRPPGNRNPTAAEMALSHPFIERHIVLLNPAVVILLGGISAKTLTGRSEGITRLRGRWLDLAIPGAIAPVPALATFHPSFLLRSPSQKREAWIDLLTMKRRLEELGV